MTQNNFSADMTERGSLTVRVSTASGAIPLEGVAVNIRGGELADSSVIYALSTNSDGLTPTVSLPTPPRINSEYPQSTQPPYAVYNVDVFMDGYSPAFFHNVPVFSGINSIQPVILLPLLENAVYPDPQHVTETPIGGDGR